MEFGNPARGNSRETWLGYNDSKMLLRYSSAVQMAEEKSFSIEYVVLAFLLDALLPESLSTA